MQGHPVAAREFNGAQVEDFGAVRSHFQGFFLGEGAQAVGLGDDARVGGEEAVDVRVDFAHVGVEAAARATAVVSEPPRPRVVTSSSLEMPWKPATMATCPSLTARATRSGTMPMIWAAPKWLSVLMPAWAPV